MSERVFPDVRPEVVAKFREAEAQITQKVGGAPALEETMTDFAKSYKDQFVDVCLRDEVDGESNPYLILAVYKTMRDAIDLYIVNQMKVFGLDLTADEIAYYLAPTALGEGGRRTQ